MKATLSLCEENPFCLAALVVTIMVNRMIVTVKQELSASC